MRCGHHHPPHSLWLAPGTFLRYPMLFFIILPSGDGLPGSTLPAAKGSLSWGGRNGEGTYVTPMAAPTGSSVGCSRIASKPGLAAAAEPRGRLMAWGASAAPGRVVCLSVRAPAPLAPNAPVPRGTSSPWLMFSHPPTLHRRCFSTERRAEPPALLRDTAVTWVALRFWLVAPALRCSPRTGAPLRGAPAGTTHPPRRQGALSCARQRGGAGRAEPVGTGIPARGAGDGRGRAEPGGRGRPGTHRAAAGGAGNGGVRG